MTASNPFATETAWEVNTGTFLTAGDWATEIYEAEQDESSNGNPQIALNVGCADGAIKDWIVITPATYGKVVQLIQAVGIEPPSDDEVEIHEGSGNVIPTKAYLK